MNDEPKPGMIVVDDYTIEEFCKTHHACQEGRWWAIENCGSMREAWEKLPAKWLIWVATRKNVLSDKELRLFAVYCARTVAHLLTDKRSLDAISVAERYAEGQATNDELFASWFAARDAARGAAAWIAARDAAAWTAARDAARGAARDAAKDAAYEQFAAYLRANATPNFAKAKGGEE